MILDRLKKIDTDVDVEILEQVSQEFDEEINKIDKSKTVYINVNIIKTIKIRIMKNLKINNIKGQNNNYCNNEEKSIKVFKSRLKTK